MFSETKKSTQNPNSSKPDSAEQYLRFILMPQTQVMLPLSQLSEVLTLTLTQIVPIPSLPNWVVGVYNWRGEILWMVDLGALVGLESWHQQASTNINYRVIILRGENLYLGLVVPQVEDMEWCNSSEIYSPPPSAIIPGMAPFLRGYWLKADGTIVMILNGEAILAAMPS